MKVLNSIIVALFVRAPVSGRVKTRLAADLGNETACRFYKAMVTDIICNIRLSGFPIYMFYDQGNIEKLPEDWIAASSKVLPQGGDTIGERMAAAFEYCFSQNIEKVILLGSDIPGIDSHTILSAANGLKNHDMVISPAFDGGYCQIGIKKETYQPMIFENVPWSSEQVLQATLNKCVEYGLNVKLLDTLQDIDTINDMKAYCSKASENSVFTNRELASMGFLDKS